MFSDTHCHLNFNSFQNDLPRVLDRAREAGVERILIPGTNLLNSREAIQLCENHPGLFAAVGIHPSEALGWEKTTCESLKELIAHPRVVAIGEIGLDFYHNDPSPEIQQRVFSAQLELAEEMGLPVIIHNRNSFSAVKDLIGAWMERIKTQQPELAKRPGVFHSFEGNIEEADIVMRMGFLIGITGPITYPKSLSRQAMVKSLPFQSMILETDSPFLPPQPFRGQRNEPSYVTLIATRIAEIKDTTCEIVARITTQNAMRLFLWDPKS